MRLSRGLVLFGFAFTAIVGLQGVPHAFAGFQWVPPRNEPQKIDQPLALDNSSVGVSSDEAFVPLPPDNSRSFEAPLSPDYDEPNFIERLMGSPKTRDSAAMRTSYDDDLTPLPGDAIPETPSLNSPPDVARDSVPIRKPVDAEYQKRLSEFENDADHESVFHWMRMEDRKNTAEEAFDDGKIQKEISAWSTERDDEKMRAGITNEPLAPADLYGGVPGKKSHTSSASLANASGQFEQVEGFGSDLPLALALSQIVPPRYAYSFGAGVNAGEKVSWTGGKPWNKVVEDMVSPAGLSASLAGQNAIMIEKSGGSGQKPKRLSPGFDDSEFSSPLDGGRRNIRDPGLDSRPMFEESRRIQDGAVPADIGSPMPPPPVSAPPVSVSSGRSAAETGRMLPKEDPSIPLGAKPLELPKPTWTGDEEIKPDPSLVKPPPISDYVAPGQGDDILVPLNEPARSSGSAPSSDRPSYAQRVQQEIEQENLEMRISDAAPSVGAPEIVAPVEAYRPGEKVAIKNYQPPSYQQDLPEFASAADMENREAFALSPAQKAAAVNTQMPVNKVAGAPDMWEARKGDGLKETLTNWSRKANINFVWKSDKDYDVSSNVLVSGPFRNAISTLFAQGLNGLDKPTMRFVDNPNANEPTTFIVGE